MLGFQEARLSSGDPSPSRSGGVGGVFTIAGASLSSLVGVAGFRDPRKPRGFFSGEGVVLRFEAEITCGSVRTGEFAHDSGGIDEGCGLPRKLERLDDVGRVGD